MRLAFPLRQPLSRLTLHPTFCPTRRFLSSSLLACGLCLSLCLSLPQSVRADERQDFRAWSNFLKEQAPLKLEPKDVLASYDGFLQAHPTLSPNAVIVVVTYKADTLAKGLKDPAAAVALLDQALTFYSQPENLAAPDSLMRLVRFKSQVLIGQKKWAEVEPLLRDNWKRIIAVGQQAESRNATDVAELAHHYIWALDGVGKTAEIVPVLTQTLSEVPGLLSGQGQRRDGSFYEDLVVRLLEADRKDEAIAWAKLQYVLCPFEATALERSTKLLVRAWAGQGQEGLTKMVAFSKAQKDLALPNPLADVKLPALSNDTLAAQYDRLQGAKGRSITPTLLSDLITLDLVAGQFGAAMQRATKLLQEQPGSPVGGQEVTRVFKAAQLNLVGANQFLAYLKGQEANPVPAFLEKYGTETKTAGTPTTTVK